MRATLKYKILFLLTFFASLNFQVIKSDGWREKFKDKKVWIGVGVAALFGGVLYYYFGYNKKAENSKNKKQKSKKKSNELEEIAEVEDYDSTQDDEAIEQILKDTWEYLIKSTGDDIKTHWKKIKENPAKIIKVIRNNNRETVAFISYAINNFIYNIGVRKKYQRKGYGKRLLDYTINDMVSRFEKTNKDNFQIETNIRASNEPVVEFFTKNNFVKNEKRKDSYIYKPIK